MSSSSVVLAIDPAKAAGFALFVDGELRVYGAADGSMWRTLIEAMRTITPWVAVASSDMQCVIEDGFYSGPRNFKAVMTLGRRRGLAQAAGEFYGFRKFEFVDPQKWQRALGYKRGGDSKAFSLAFVKAQYGVEAISDDVSDAICIGHYYLTTLNKAV